MIPGGEESFFASQRFFKRCFPETLEIDGIESDQKLHGSESVDDTTNLASSLLRNPLVDAGNCVGTLKRQRDNLGCILLSCHGLLSPRGLGIALLTVCIGIVIWAVIIIRKTAAELRETPTPQEVPIDGATRKRRLLGVRAGQLAIVILALSLLSGLRQIGTAPLFPLAVGAAVNLCTMWK